MSTLVSKQANWKHGYLLYWAKYIDYKYKASRLETENSKIDWLISYLQSVCA